MTTTTEQATLHVYCRDGEDHWVADSIERAIALQEETTGETEDPADWWECPDSEMLTIVWEDPDDLPEGLRPEQVRQSDDGPEITRTCGEWAADGEGPLCSTYW